MEVRSESAEGYRVYVLRNAEGRGYIGVTDDVNRRLVQHNQGVSKWTRGRGPWILEWSSTPRSLGDARALENLMKRQKGGAGLETLMQQQGSSGS
jgi:putative endonuclease